MRGIWILRKFGQGGSTRQPKGLFSSAGLLAPRRVYQRPHRRTKTTTIEAQQPLVEASGPVSLSHTLDKDTEARLRGWTLPYQLYAKGEDMKPVTLVVMNTDGGYKQVEKPLPEILTITGMHIRDYIALESPTTTSVSPTSKCIVVAMSHVRLVILPNEIHFFQTHRPIVKDFIRSMSDFLSTCQNLSAKSETATLDFGLVVMEGVFSAVATKYARRVHCFQPVLEATLRELRQTEARASRRTIHRLLPLRNSLSRFEQASERLLRTITDLLKSDDYMASLKVNSLNREWTENDWREHVKKTHVDVELMLESYHSRFQSYLEASFMMRKQIAATLELLEIALDKQRNALIKLNLQFTIATISVGCGAWVGSTFGMNLTSGLEEHPMMFYMVTASTLLLSGVVYTGGIRMTEVSERSNANKKIDEDYQFKPKTFENMDDVQDLMLKHLDVEDRQAVDREEFNEMLRGAAGTDKVIGEEEVNRIFEIFDSNDDGKLSHSDIVQFICNQHGRARSAERRY